MNLLKYVIVIASIILLTGCIGVHPGYISPVYRNYGYSGGYGYRDGWGHHHNEWEHHGGWGHH
jgi:hypothetical protein